MKTKCAIFAIALLSRLLSADSLWDDGFQGYIAGSSAFRVGDIVTLVIDAKTSLDFAASSKDAKTITFEFSGGEYGGLFSYLPAAKTGGDRSVTGRQKYALETELSANVVQIDPSGKLLVSGSRSVQVEGKQETITVSGRVDPKTIDSTGRFNFAQLENSRLAFTSFLQPQVNTLTAADIEEVVRELGAAELPPAGTAEPEATVRLTDRKKRELLLLYLNRLVDVLFR